MNTVAQRMVEIDSRLSEESMNWNHNLAHVFRHFNTFKDSPKRARAFKTWTIDTAAFWLQRGKNSGAIKEISIIDSQLAKDIKLKLTEIDIVISEIIKEQGA